MVRNDDDLEAGSADLFDREQLRDYVTFASGAVRRHRMLVAAVISGIVGLAALATLALPRTYHVEAKLLAQRSPTLVVRGDGQDAVAPTRGAVETIRRRDNLVALIEATDLLHHWDEHRAPLQRLLDGLRSLVHTDDADERTDAMVERLDKRLTAWTNDGTVVIAIDWPDARMAARLVDLAQQNFLEARHAQEITALAESIAILETHAKRLRVEVDDAVAALEELRDKRQGSGADGAAASKTEVGAASTRQPSAPRAAEPRPELERLQASLSAKKRALDDLEDLRRRRLSEAQVRLTEQRATYTDNHPVIIDLRQTIAALEVPSPQLKELRGEVASLLAEQERMGAEAGAHGAPRTSAASPIHLTPLPSEILRLDDELREDRAPAVVYARGKLRDAMDKYSALCEKVQAAQIDLETAQAAFKYRYSILTPAKVPKKPVKPTVPLILLAAFVAAVAGAIVVVVVADVRSGLLVERWQIERLLERPVLGEIVVAQLPRAQRHRAQ